MNNNFSAFVNQCFDSPHLQCIDSGYMHFDKTWQYKNVTSPFTRLYFVEKGAGILTVGNKKIELKPNFAYLVPTNLKFDYSCDDYLVKSYFHLNLIDDAGFDIFKNIKEIKSVEVSPEEIAEVTRFLNPPTLEDAFRLRRIIFATLEKLFSEITSPDYLYKTHSPLIDSAVAYIKANLSNTLTAKTVAKHLFISESNLHKLFKAETGTPLGQYIDTLIFFNAQLMLSKTDLSLKDISEKLGFRDQFHFSRRFKELSGVSPSFYRKQQTLRKI